MTNALNPAPSRKRCLSIAGVLIAFIGLSGCAGAHVTRVQEFTAIEPPGPIVVETSLPEAVAKPGPDILDAARSLQEDVLKDLIKVRIPATGPAKLSNAAGMAPSGVILDIRIVSVDPGDLAERLALGFGLGRSTLAVKVSLVDARHSPSTTLLAFDVASDSGRGPGLILPAGVAAGTADALGFAIGGGTGLLLNARNGPEQDAAHTAAAITTRLSAYFVRVGWVAQS